MGFGGPDSLEAVGPFMARLMGREPSAETLARAHRKYLTIGGASPLPAIADGIAKALQDRLHVAGRDIPVRVGMRYWLPSIHEGLASLAAEGASRVIAASLSPFDSEISTGAYRRAVEAALGEVGPLEVIEAPRLGGTRSFQSHLVEATKTAIEEVEDSEKLLVVFTAHSIPEGEGGCDAHYADGVRAVVQAIVQDLGFAPPSEIADESLLPGVVSYGSPQPPQPWVFSYQSKGVRDCPWLGPDLGDVISAAHEGGFTALVVCPVGFATDHMETLYDLDVEAAGRAYDLDMQFFRAPAGNDGPVMIEAFMEILEPLLAE